MSDKNFSDMSDDEIRAMAGATSPAGELRAAAKLLRDRANSATSGPWRYNPVKHFRYPGTSTFEESVFTGPAGKDALSVARTGPSDDPQSMADADYIASMHPVVALAVADLLDEVAADSHPSLPAWVEDATAKIARAYLESA